MDQLLKPQQAVYIETTGTPCTVEKLLGAGGQGEVYQVRAEGTALALKWYYPHILQDDVTLRERLSTAVKRGAPNDRFLWPLALASDPNVPGFGYVMPLREPQFKSIVDLMRRRVEPSFRALATAGFELSNAFLDLHARGWCYRDINFGNVFFNPISGGIRVCDNDNVDVNGTASIIGGTMRFMAPEIVRGEVQSPNRETDLFSLSVLLFYMLMIHHPLEGEREARIHALDSAAMTRLYGTEPVFIFDPQDESNRPVPGVHDNALDFWSVYPQFLRDIFTKAFTTALRDSKARIYEGEWVSAMVRLRDTIMYCGSCGVENFYDLETLKAAPNSSVHCWACKQPVTVPPRIRIGSAVVMLNHDTMLFPHHVDGERKGEFSQPVAKVTQHPSDPGLWGLQNLSNTSWTATMPDGQTREVEPGRNLRLGVGVKVNFGRAQGEIRL